VQKTKPLIGNPALMRQTNARTILMLLKNSGICSRKDLVSETGMSTPTVANVIADLNKLGLIEWVGEDKSGGGRPPEKFRFKAEAGCFAGVEVTLEGLRILLTDLNGKLLEEHYQPVPKEARGPALVIERLYASLGAMMQRQRLQPKQLRAMTVGVAGITNMREGVVISVSDSESWRNVPLRTMLRQFFSCEVMVDNESNLAAMGERFCGVAQAEESFIFITINSGVGAGIFVNGQIVYGASWAAGEIGYLHVPHIPSLQPALHEFGPLEQVLAGPGILKSWAAVAKKSGVPLKPRTARRVLDLALEGNAAAQKLVLHRAQLLEDVVLNLSLTLNPGLFVFGGEVGSHPALLAPMAEMLSKSEIAVARVVPSSLGNSAVVWGGVACAMQHSEQNLHRC
jgi:predicted NBD/HSP70 family sugar kinase